MVYFKTFNTSNTFSANEYYSRYNAKTAEPRLITVLYGNKYGVSLSWFSFIYCVHLYFIIIIF